MNFRSLARRLLKPTPPQAEVAAAAQPEVNFGAIGHLFERKPIDTVGLAASAGTEFERIYYSHEGRTLFKWVHYLPTYDRLLTPFVGKPITLVEIGLAGGGSIELWRKFLGPQIRFIGVDIEPGCKTFEEEGVEILIGDQGDPDFLRRVAKAVGQADIIIDDGSHICSHQILTFEKLFPIVKIGGLFICEDLHTSYWPSYGGGLGREDTFTSFAKTIIDKMHYKYGVGELAADDPVRNIGAMTVIDSLIAFEKVAEKDISLAWVGA